MTASSQMSLSEQSAALTLLGLSEFCEKKIENSALHFREFCANSTHFFKPTFTL